MSSDSSLEEFTEESKRTYYDKENKKFPGNAAFAKQNVLAKKFFSDDEVKQFIKDIQDATKENYFKRDWKSKRDGSIKNEDRLNANGLLKNRFIKYLCIHSPDSRPSTSKGIRKSYTMISTCPAVISFSLSSDGKCYTISEMIEHKGHEILSNFRDLLPQNRKLTTKQKSLVKKHVETKSSKLQVMSQLMAEGKKVTLRDVSNLKYQIKQDGKKNNFEEVLHIMKKNDAIYEVKYGEDQSFQGLFFFTKYMQATFDAWPEFLLIDSTYKLLELEYPIVVIVAVDGNGSTELIAFAIVTHENEETFQWIIDSLKKHNASACMRIKAFMADKDMIARNVIEKTLQVRCYICSFHVLQRFRLVVLSTDISKDKKKECLALLEELRYSISEDEYNIKYANFCEKAPDEIRSYYDNNWHAIRKDWVKCYMTVSNYCNETNNRLESLNQKFKLMLELHSYLTDFMSSLFDFLRVHKNERDLLVVVMFSKRPRFQLSEDQYKYLNFLTKYAAEYVFQEIEKMSWIKYITQAEDAFVVRSSSTEKIKYHVTLTSCDCIDFKSMGLPCRHLLKVRQSQNLPLYDESLCLERWTKRYFVEKHRLFQSVKIPQQVLSKSDSECVHTGGSRKVKVGSDKSANVTSCKTVSEITPKVVNEQNLESFVVQNNNNKLEITKSAKNVKIPQQVVPESDSESAHTGGSSKVKVGTVKSANVNPCKTVSEITPNVVNEPNLESFVVQNNNSKLEITKSAIANPCETAPKVVHPAVVNELNPESINTVESENVRVETPKAKDVILDRLRTKKGRPKGSILKAVGLLKKPRLTNCKNFTSMSNVEKATILFRYILKNDVLQKKTLGVNLISSNDLIDMRAKVACWLYYEEIVDLEVLQGFMQHEAYRKLAFAVAAYKHKLEWICAMCNQALYSADSVMCDQCIRWMHLKCIRLKKAPKGDFYCAKCKSE